MFRCGLVVSTHLVWGLSKIKWILLLLYAKTYFIEATSYLRNFSPCLRREMRLAALGGVFLFAASKSVRSCALFSRGPFKHREVRSVTEGLDDRASLNTQLRAAEVIACGSAPWLNINSNSGARSDEKISYLFPSCCNSLMKQSIASGGVDCGK
jgi:hypothetical protein